MALLLVVGDNWIRRSGRSPEWWDSWVIMLWVRIMDAQCARAKLVTGHSQYIY